MWSENVLAVNIKAVQGPLTVKLGCCESRDEKGG